MVQVKGWSPQSTDDALRVRCVAYALPWAACQTWAMNARGRGSDRFAACRGRSMNASMTLIALLCGVALGPGGDSASRGCRWDHDGSENVYRYGMRTKRGLRRYDVVEQQQQHQQQEQQRQQHDQEKAQQGGGAHHEHEQQQDQGHAQQGKGAIQEQQQERQGEKKDPDLLDRGSEVPQKEAPPVYGVSSSGGAANTDGTARTGGAVEPGGTSSAADTGGTGGTSSAADTGGTGGTSSAANMGGTGGAAETGGGWAFSSDLSPGDLAQIKGLIAANGLGATSPGGGSDHNAVVRERAAAYAANAEAAFAAMVAGKPSAAEMTR